MSGIVNIFNKKRGMIPSLFAFTTATFSSPRVTVWYETDPTLRTTCFGPSQGELQSYYNSNSPSVLGPLLSANIYFKVPINGYQWFKVPSTGNYTIVAQGGTGGPTNKNGRAGCKLTATFALTEGDILWIAIGQNGSNGNSGTDDWCGAGGGGATIVSYAPPNGGTILSNVTKCLICAAGGKGASEGRFGETQPAQSNPNNGTTGNGFINNFKANNGNGGAGGYGGYYSFGGFGGGNGVDDGDATAGGYDAYYSSSPNSFIDDTATNITRLAEASYSPYTPGFVIITKI